jgi:SOS response regulatory protein OraA/RecX
MNHWWRAYNEAVNDPKLQLISDSLFRAWFNIMCIASANDGILPAVNDLAFTLRMKPEQVAKVITQLHGHGLLDKTETSFAPHNWNGRQYKSDVSTERVKRFRKQQRNVSSTVSETPPEQNQTTEQSRADARPAFEDDFLKALAEAFGRPDTDLTRAKVWLSRGYSSTMILETVREVLARGTDVGSLGYFDSILAERHANRQETPSERAAAKVDMDNVAAMFKKTGVWSRYAGPEPGMIGCRCPPEILAKYGIVTPEIRRMNS